MTDAPWVLAPSAMLPPLLACSVSSPVAVIVELTVMVPGVSLSVRVNAAPLEAPVIVTALVSVMLTAPVVFTCKPGEFRAPTVIAPEPDVRIAVPVVAVRVPADCVIVPVVVAISVTDDP